MGKVLCEEEGGKMEETDLDWERLAAPESCCFCLLLGVEENVLLLLEQLKIFDTFDTFFTIRS